MAEPDRDTFALRHHNGEFVGTAIERGSVEPASLAGVVEPAAPVDLEARAAEIEETFDHQQMPLLEKYELAKEYVSITEAQISRHDVAKPPGRPEGAISLAARRLPVPGRTHPARKKWLERALAVANLQPTVKDEARKKGIARYQCRLLEVAEVEGEEAQLQKVQEIANRVAKGPPAGHDGWLRAVVRYPADCKAPFLEKLTELVEEFDGKLEG
jgi:hypothetical protein